MNGRTDKHGQTLGMGDRVRCPTGRAGSVRGFAESAGRQRAVVEYDETEFGEVVLLPRLLERVSAKNKAMFSRRALSTKEGRNPLKPTVVRLA